MRPSSRPVHSWPSVSTTTSSGPFPGSGTTVIIGAGMSGNGSTGGGCHRTGSIRGLRAMPRTLRPGVDQHAAQDGFDGVELGLSADQRWSQLNDGLGAVVDAAVQPGFEERRRDVGEQLFAFFAGEGLLGGLVLDQFDSIEVTLAADVADDGQVVEL